MKRSFCMFFCCLHVIGCVPAWENIQSFFSFYELTEEEFALYTKESSIKQEGDELSEKEKAFFWQNLQILIELQLGLPCGRNMWQAFFYWKEKHKSKFSFVFQFNFQDIPGANISLRAFDKRSKKFVFHINCNRIFKERIFSKEEILQQCKLCRPCLIKLGGKYHLREQILPFFITLAHEFLHGLNRLEKIESICMDDRMLESFLDPLTQENLLQEFLRQKIRVDGTDLIFGAQRKLWENSGRNDSLDEMTAILESKRKISDKEEVSVGETTFLREHYKDPSIISWSHEDAHDIIFWTKNMPLLLKEDYVESVLRSFSLDPSNIPDFRLETVFEVKFCTCFGSSQNKPYFMDYLKRVIHPFFVSGGEIAMRFIYKSGTSDFSFLLDMFPCQKTETGQNIVLLPRVTFREIQPCIEPKLKGYEIFKIPVSGNNAFMAVKVARDQAKTTKLQPIPVETLRKQTADLMTSMKYERADFVMMFRKPGFWNNGVDGEVGFRVLNYVAQIVEQPILVLVGDISNGFRYWVSKPLGAPADVDVPPESIGERKPEQLLDEHPECIKLFHNGIYYQLIVPKSEVATE